MSPAGLSAGILKALSTVLFVVHEDEPPPAPGAPLEAASFLSSVFCEQPASSGNAEGCGGQHAYRR
ncbi:hypothetical protein ACU686_28250 [Yinghuangia aomiensis]